MNIKQLTRKVNWSFYAMQFASFASSFAIFLYVTVILQSKNFSNTEIGLTVALGSALSIVLPPLIALFYAHHPRMPLKYITSAVRIITLVFSVLLIFVDSPVAVVSFIFIVISGTTITSGSLNNGLAMQFEATPVRLNFGVGRAAGSMGCIMMSVLTGILAGGTDMIIALSALLLAVSIVLTLFFDRPEKAGGSIRGTQQAVRLDGKIAKAAPAAQGGSLKLLRDPACLLFFFVMMLSFANVGVLDTYQVDILKSVGGTDADYGILLMIMVTVEMPVMLLFRRLSRRFSITALMCAGFVALLLKDIALLFAGSVAAVFAMQAFNMAAIGLFFPAQVYYSNFLVDPARTVQAQTLFTGTAISVGRIIGNLLGGVIIDNAGKSALLIVAAAYSILAIAFLQASNRIQKKSLKAQLEAAG